MKGLSDKPIYRKQNIAKNNNQKNYNYIYMVHSYNADTHIYSQYRDP